MAVELPLSGVRIVALEQYGAGPYGTLHLADLGAEVIKIEPPGLGDVGRAVPPYTHGVDSLFFQSLNRNKRSLALDLTRDRGREILRELVSVSDAVFSNLRGDVPRKLGLHYDQLKEVNPRIVCCSLSGYGMTGPRADQPGFDYMVQAMSGWMSLTGEPDSLPTKTGLSVVDFSAGLVAAMALMVGLHRSAVSGVGCDCDVSLLETALSMTNYLATWHLTAGYQPTAVSRSSHPTVVPFGMFPTSDGWVMAGGSKEKFWRRLIDALGLPELATDARFVSFAARHEHRQELIRLLDRAFRTRTAQEWIGILEAKGVPCARVNDFSEAIADPQVEARGSVYFQDHPDFGAVGQIATPARVHPGGMDRVGPVLRKDAAPRLGGDTMAVLTTVLKYSESEVRDLESAGIVELGGIPSTGVG